MIATTPLQIDGQTYDRWSLNLAITGKYKAGGSPDASICMRLIPTRIAPATTDAEGNAVPAAAVTADSAAIGLLRGRLSEITDPAEAACVTAIQTALQTYITTKGL
jgi:hypothetical protein